ncbi:MAG: hypothetical protein R2710_25350 [Acidimicrobiales bacterium]
MTSGMYQRTANQLSLALPSNDQPLIAERAIARDPQTDRWHSFERPLTTLTAWTLDEVSPVLAAAERHAAQGSWVVGFVSYDAGPAFDRANRALRNERVPLAVFGVYADADDDPLDGGVFSCGDWTDSVMAEEFRAGVGAVKGTSPTATPTRSTSRTAGPQPSAARHSGLFRSLMDAQRAPYGVYLDLGFALCSASPELFLHRTPLDGGGSGPTSLPMKGLRRRGISDAEDARWPRSWWRAPRTEPRTR